MNDYLYCDYIKKHGVYMLVWYLDDRFPKLKRPRRPVGAVEAIYERTVNGIKSNYVVRCRVCCYVDNEGIILDAIDNVIRKRRVKVSMWRRF